ncbi:aldehyde dehydrogenase family protein, partial [Pseudomonas aeruginosa]|uniref:aldehyde dehydrogenase family protein n=1 Tax=Pseudomonas aeruginosa TaxID=287 RepID=UPI003EBC86A4
MNGHARHWIDGAWLDSAQRGQSFDPASGQPIGTYADGGRAEADAAIAAAVRAFEDGPWKDDHALRATALEEIAAAFERHADAPASGLILPFSRASRSMSASAWR